MAGASCLALSPQSHNPCSGKFILKMDYSGTAITFRNSSSISSGSFPTRSLSFANNLKYKNAIPQTRMLRLSCMNELSPNLEIKSKPSSLTALELLKSSGASRYTKESSSILVIGFNYETTPIDIREKLSIPEAGWAEAIGELCALNHIEEAAVLSTCNRMEIYVVALSQNRGIKEVTEWMSKRSSVPISELSQHRFVLQNNDATKHLFDVASGLDSLVLGEGQILSQVKQVVKTGEGVSGFDRKIGGMFKHALTTGKRVRTETNISTGSVSVSSAAVELAMMKLPESSRATAIMLVVGAGKMGKLVIRHLAAKGYKKIVVVNRTKDTVVSIDKDIKEDVEIVYQPLSEMLTCAVEADVVFTCTASETLLFSKDEFQKLGSGQKIFVDISVPRNVDSHVSDIDSIQIYNVDDLKEVVASNKQERCQKVMDAQAIIADEVRQFSAWKDSLETVSTIKKLRASAERIRVAELEKCLSKMGPDCPENVKKMVNDLSLGIVNKLLDGPMKHLRCKGNDNRNLDEILENMHAVNRIFSLDTDTSLLEEKILAKVEKSKKVIS